MPIASLSLSAEEAGFVSVTRKVSFGSLTVSPMIGIWITLLTVPAGMTGHTIGARHVVRAAGRGAAPGRVPDSRLGPARPVQVHGERELLVARVSLDDPWRVVDRHQGQAELDRRLGIEQPATDRVSGEGPHRPGGVPLSRPDLRHGRGRVGFEHQRGDGGRVGGGGGGAAEAPDPRHELAEERVRAAVGRGYVGLQQRLRRGERRARASSR